MEAIQKIAETEAVEKARRAAAEADARALLTEAEREGEALFEKLRRVAAESGREQLAQAEERASARAAEIGRETEQARLALRAEAERHMDEAADMIVTKILEQNA